MDYRYTITTAHGEGRTLWHIVDGHASDQPAVVKTFNSVEHHYLDVCHYAGQLEARHEGALTALDGTLDADPPLTA